MIQQLFEEELSELCGPRDAQQWGRVHYRARRSKIQNSFSPDSFSPMVKKSLFENPGSKEMEKTWSWELIQLCKTTMSYVNRPWAIW